ncbi:MAG: class I SAM-dependent methyltransferase [Rhodothermaceae bacterium]|nr:class I SAM-dependent methyltransferase [Rhodothermaceae bacterium]
MKSNSENWPDLKLIAQQLRKPSGELAARVASKMDQGNRPLFELTRDTLCIKTACNILEIGFGSGKYMKEIWALPECLSMSGVDYSDDMVKQAEANNAEALTSGKLSLINGSSDNLPFDDHSFDIAYCNMVIYFWDNPEIHLSEIYRVLKPEGKFYTGFRPRGSMLNFPFTRFNFRLYDVEDWESVLAENGFSVVGTEFRLDPELDDDGNQFQLESVCMVAAKSSDT